MCILFALQCISESGLVSSDLAQKKFLVWILKLMFWVREQEMGERMKASRHGGAMRDYITFFAALSVETRGYA